MDKLELFKAISQLIPSVGRAGSLYNAIAPDTASASRKGYHTLLNAPNPYYNLPQQPQPDAGPQVVHILGK
jgi:hypothetical protein